MKKIVVYCEKIVENNLSDVSYELISKAYSLRDCAKALNVEDNNFEIEAVVLGSYVSDDAKNKAFQSGANRVVLIKHDLLNDYNYIRKAQCFLEYYNQNPSEIILFPATPEGREVAPRVTTSLNTGLVADCTELELIQKDNEIKLASTRPTFGAELMATILSRKIPQCATVRPGVFKPVYTENAGGEFFEFFPQNIEENKIKFVQTIISEQNCEDVDFSNAKIILCAGWGLYNGVGSEYYSKLQKLAELTGAKYAATRKVVDFGIAPHSVQIGQTGNSAKSLIYVGFGVSGAIQHIAGMKNCQTIIAINNDSNAPIFGYCDYKVVADAKEIIDELLGMLM